MAIIPCVIAVVVSSVYRMVVGRPRPHVAVERLERHTPLIANLDPTCAVAVVLRASLVVASFFHVLPCSVLGCPCHPMGSRQPTAKVLSFYAPTRSGISIFQVPIGGLVHTATRTATEESSLTSLIPRQFSHNSEPAEHLSNKVKNNGPRHKITMSFCVLTVKQFGG